MAADRTSVLPDPDRTRVTPIADDDRTRVTPVLPETDRTAVVAPLSPPGPRRIPAAASADSETRVVGDLGSAPGGFARPNRPAWTPMEMRPAARRGITVLGTTLTHRQAAIGLGIVLTFLLLLGIILVQAFGDDSSSANAGVPTQVAAGGAAAPGKSEPARGGNPKPAPSGASRPSSAPPSSVAAGTPAGWRTYKGSGFSLPLPKGARTSGGGAETRVNFDNRLLIINRVNQELDDPADYWREQSTGHYGNYHNLGVTEVDYHGDAADWEFTYTTSSGNGQHVVRRVFEIEDQAWSLSWYTSPDDWDAAEKDLEAIFQGFRAS